LEDELLTVEQVGPAPPVPPSLPSGIMAPLLTPFDDDGEIDRAALAQSVDFYVRGQAHALFAFGVAGQGPAMRADQRRTAAELIMDRVSGRIPVVFNIGTADVQTTLQIARHAAELHPAALAVSPPYYYSDHTPYEVSAHFAAVAEAVDVPLLIYDNPRYAGIGMSPSATLRLSRALPSIAGIIIENPTLDAILQYLRTIPRPFAVYSGAIECLLPTAPYGLAGVVSGPCSPFPELCAALWRAVEQHQYEEAFLQQLQLNEIAAVLDRYAIITGRTVFRDVLRLRDVPVKRYPRWPSQELEPDALDRLKDELTTLGAFAAPFKPPGQGTPTEQPTDAETLVDESADFAPDEEMPMEQADAELQTPASGER
jgi:dihydrodipicolinate synthase/N-acetylneuraminate lyase